MLKKMNTISLLLLFLISGTFILHSGLQVQAGKSKQEKRIKKHEKIIRNGLKNKNSVRYWDAVAKIFIRASNEKIQEYKQSSKLSLSLHAAWEQLKRSSFTRVKKVKQKSDDEEFEEEPVLEVPALEMGRFIGFLESKIKVKPPEWWIAIIKSNFSFPDPPKNEIFNLIEDKPYYGYEIGGKFKNIIKKLDKKHRTHCKLYCIDTLDLFFMPEQGRQIPYEGFLIKSEQYQYLIPEKYFLDYLDHGDHLNFTGFTAWMNQEFCIFAFHPPLSSEMTLRCINRETSKLIWEKKCPGYSYGGFTGGMDLFNFIEIRSDNKKVYLFGANGEAPYLEVFSLKNGKRLEQFRSDYYLDED